MPSRFLRRSFSLRTLFILINLIVLVLPIFGIVALRIFENIIHRQTEDKLISEGAYVQALYLPELLKQLDGATLKPPLCRYTLEGPTPLFGQWRPHFPMIDLSRHAILPPASPGRLPRLPAPLAAQSAGAAIQPLLKEAQLQTLSAVRVLDADGVVVASTGIELGEDLSHRHEISQALLGRYCSVLRRRIPDQDQPAFASLRQNSISRASRIRVFVAIPMIQGYKLLGIVYLSRTSLSITRALWDVRYFMALLLLLAVTLLISMVLSSVVTRPLKSMVRQAERIARGEANVSLSLGPTASSEARQLSEALSAMVERLRERMHYVQEFSRNVSHEFKTPLTGIQGAIELLREKWQEMTESERSRFLGIIETEVRRMERLVKRLLELTRIEMTDPSDAETDLAELLEHMTHRYSDAGQDVRLVRQAAPARARIAPDLAETLFVNLIE
ncbi:MAG: hypothetical protein A2V67_10595, partial [Deltaproteobacteria bacterium RBG_13_61_14]